VPGDENERRSADRVAVSWDVDCVAKDTFLYASITNISAMGIFIRTDEPLPVGTPMDLAFAPPGHSPFRLHGRVAWVNPLRPNGDNPNPGMGVRFTELSSEARERLVDVIHAITYVRDPS